MKPIFKKRDKVFYLCLVLTLIVLGVMIYVSITSRSTEEFVELYWQVFKLENLRNTTNVVCEHKNCSLSGVYMAGDVNLFGENYKAVISDSNEIGIYDSLCIDINYDGIFCGNHEGPWNVSNTFFIDSQPFYILKLNKDEVVITNYPKETNITNFSVSFVIKSHYKETMNFDATLFVNETLEANKTFTIEPDHEKISFFDVNLPNAGWHKVRIIVQLQALNKSTEINFWVLRL